MTLLYRGSAGQQPGMPPTNTHHPASRFVWPELEAQKQPRSLHGLEKHRSLKKGHTPPWPWLLAAGYLIYPLEDSPGKTAHADLTTPLQAPTPTLTEYTATAATAATTNPMRLDWAGQVGCFAPPPLLGWPVLDRLVYRCPRLLYPPLRQPGVGLHELCEYGGTCCEGAVHQLREVPAHLLTELLWEGGAGGGGQEKQLVREVPRSGEQGGSPAGMPIWVARPG